MSSKLKSLSVNFSLLVVSTLLALLITEVILRIGKTLGIMQTHQQLFVEHHPLLGWQKIPNATGVHRTPEYTVEQTFNSRGLRGPEYSYEKSKEEYRILILGDSFAEGYTVSFDELFSEVLKRRLVHPSKRIEVINAGTGGYSTDQEILFFSQYGKKYAPDLTILLFYQNDIWYNGQTRYWRGFKPRFDLVGNGDLSLSGVPVPLPGTHNDADSGVARLKRWLKTDLYAYRLVSKGVRSLPALNGIVAKAGLVDSAPEEFRVFEKGYSQRFTELTRLTEALLLKLRDDTASVGSRFLIFYVPFHASIYHDELEKMERLYGMKEGSWNPEQPGIVLQNICERHGLECLDPTELFKKADDRLYFVDDEHWNPLGHRTVGETLAGYIATHLLDE